MALSFRTDTMRLRWSFLALGLVLIPSGCGDAASLVDTKDTVSEATLMSVFSIASCICLAITLIGCSFCCRTGFAKFEETTTEQSVVGQNYTSFADFSPPTMSTPSHPPGASDTDAVTIEPLPQLPGRTTNQWVNVLRVGGGGGSSPGQTVQSIKLIDSPRFQFPRSQISYVDEMGNGWFGKVLQGEAQRMHPGLRKTRVVVKQLRDNASPEEQLLFLQEVQPYREVNHPNVLLLLGQCIDSMPLLLILEYAPFGDLKSYLRKHRSEAQEMAHQDIQLKMANDMINGLMWLHQADFIYVDLATRNCQVSADTSIKIGDYGLALEKYPDDYYITRDNSQAIPIRWLGPEVIDLKDDGSVRTKKITKESNVWSFGIMMLELSTGARRPYAKLTDEQVLQQVVKEQEIRVDKPNLNIHYANRWFEIMMYCWLEADIRPNMKELHGLLLYLKNNRDRIDMPDFEAHWNSLKPAALQESSDTSKEEEGPATPVQKNLSGPGFEDNFVHPLATTPEKRSTQQRVVTPVKKAETPIKEPPTAKTDSLPGFDSDFGKMAISSGYESTTLDVSSPNRNMNAETNDPDDQPLFNDFVRAVVHPTAESIPPQLADRPNEGFQSDFVAKAEISPSPLFRALEDGIEMKNTSPKKEPQTKLHSKAELSDNSSPDVSPTKTPLELHPSVINAKETEMSQEKEAAPPTFMMQEDRQRSSTPLSDEVFESSTNISVVSPADDDGPNSFLSSANLTLNQTPAPSDISLSFHSVTTPISDDHSFTSFNDVTPSTVYQTPDQSQDDTFDTVTSSQSEEPTFIIKPDFSPAHIKLSNPFNSTSDTEHSPTEFTGYVTADMTPATPSSEVIPQAFQPELVVETDGSLVVEPPGENTLGQSVFEFSDSNVASPANQQFTSQASFIPQSPLNPLTITMTSQEDDPEGTLTVQSGDVSMSRSVTSSSSSTRVVRTMRTVRQIQIVGGEEIVTDVTSPVEDGEVSIVPGSDEDGTNTLTLTGGELQSASQQSYQSSHQTSSSVMKQTSSSEKMSSLSFSQDGDFTSTDGTTSVMSGERSSSEMVGDMESMMRQMSEDSSVKRQISSSSSSTSVRSSQTSVRQISSSSSISKLTSGAELTIGDNSALMEQLSNMSSFSQSSQSMTRSEVSSKMMSSSDQDGKMTMSSSMNQAKSQQQSSSIQVMTQSSGDPQQPMTFDLNALTIGSSNGHSLVQSDPESTVEKTMTYSSEGPGQMTVGQAISMHGGGSAMDETENGVQVSMKWQGSASMKQEQSVFSSNVMSTGDPVDQLQGLPGQSSQLAITSPEGDSALED
ncbi:serine/threonine-protein kinase LMTK2-like isoform X2 [Asterias rubens]|uniref:serine/threonine-protein kinase LMTK2-like isoform X2 n=1 Tax=Asterias rubens TaxID=7604 RepID=UPI0014559A91|nr:serine/threonine-protein kinase LMTK2-like isoform X2 [Asterias rubens]